MADKEEEPPPPKKPDSFIGFIIALVVVSAVAAGAGWFVVGQLEGTNATNDMQVTSSEADDAHGETSEHGEGEKSDHVSTSLIVLDPLIVDLQDSQRSWLRLELAIVAEAGAELDDEENKLRLVHDIVSFARTLTIQQISGPSGSLHLREDLLDRARLSTGGFVESVLITSMVVE